MHVRLYVYKVVLELCRRPDDYDYYSQKEKHLLEHRSHASPFVCTSPFYRGPSAVEMENVDKAIATVTGLQVGTYYFRLTVRDQQGLSSASTLTVAVKKGEWTW